MSKEKRLGRGLEALLGKVAAAQSNAVDAAEIVPEFATKTAANVAAAVAVDAAGDGDAQIPPASATASKSVADMIEDEKERVLAQFSANRPASEIAIDSVDRNPFQPRLDFDEATLSALASSIAQHGMIQPIVVRQKGERYEIIAGERRLRAAKQAGWTTVPAHFLTVDDRETAELALTENMQRSDLNPIEKAVAFKNYLDQYGGSREELAKRLELDRSTVSNFIRLLDLPEEIQKMTREGKLTQGHARALLPLEEWDQLELARRVVEENLSVRQTETIVQEFLEGAELLPPRGEKKKTDDSPRVRELEQQFRTWLGMKVKLTSNDKGKGKLVVQFNSNDEFERVYQALKPRDY